MKFETAIEAFKRHTPIEQLTREFDDLLVLCQEHKVNSVLEIGSRFGGTLRCWLQLLLADRVVSIDLPIETDPTLLASRKSLWHSWTQEEQLLYIIQGASEAESTKKALQRYFEVSQTDSFDLVFIDGGHTFEQVSFDYAYYGPLAKKIIALHDITPSTILGPEVIDVRRFWDQAKKNKDFREIEHPENDRGGYGIGVILR